MANTGRVAGVETVQLYLRFPAEADEPEWLLRAFAKTPMLQPGASAALAFALAPSDLSVWEGRVDDDSGRWAVVRGAFDVAVGSSSRDHRLLGAFVF